MAAGRSTGPVRAEFKGLSPGCNGALKKACAAERDAIIDRGNVLPRPMPLTWLTIIYRIDALHGEHHFVGSLMARGFVFLAAAVDWFSRRVLAWRLSITLETEFCLEAVNEALARHGKPEIFNTDQGSQFTSVAFTGMLLDQKIAISMDGRGAWRDNVFVERLWRSVKYEEVYLRAYDSVSDARASLGRYLNFYNARRPHSSLGARTPEQAYLDHLPQVLAA